MYFFYYQAIYLKTFDTDSECAAIIVLETTDPTIKIASYTTLAYNHSTLLPTFSNL